MKQQVRQVLIKTAEKNGISWREHYEELAASGIQQQANQLTNPAVQLSRLLSSTLPRL